MKKFLALKSLFFLWLIIALWSFILSVSVYYSSIEVGIFKYYLVIRTLVISSGFYFPFVIPIFAGQLFSLEYENNISEVLKLRNKANLKFYITKYLISIVFIVISYMLIASSSYIVESLFNLNYGSFEFNVVDSHIVFTKNNMCTGIITVYFNQFLGSIFIFNLLLTTLFITNNYIKSIIITIISVFSMDFLGYFLGLIYVDYKYLLKFLPLNCEYVWRSFQFLQINELAIGLFVFSFIAPLYNWIIFKKNFKKGVSNE